MGIIKKRGALLIAFHITPIYMSTAFVKVVVGLGRSIHLYKLLQNTKAIYVMSVKFVYFTEVISLQDYAEHVGVCNAQRVESLYNFDLSGP